MASTKYKKNYRGRYEAKVWDGTFDSSGEKNRVLLYSTKSSAELERKVQDFKKSIEEKGAVQFSSMSFCHYADHWFDTKKSMLEINTRNMYKRIIDTHLSFLEGVLLSDISNSHFQQAINKAISKPRTCQQIYLTFRQIMSMAESDNLITAAQYLLICRNISMPKYKRAEKRPLSVLEKEAIKKTSFEPMEEAFIYILFGCGLRRGEALALTVFDFDFIKNTVTVNKTIVFDENTSVLKNCPKSDNGFRTIPIPDETLSVLKPYVQSLSGTYLFTKQDDGIVTKSCYRRFWARIISKINTAAGGTDSFPIITDLTAHIFRHNYCTNLCYQVPTISIKKVAQLLGDSEKMVLDVYNHIIEEKEDTFAVVNAALAL